jgi:preprotein translocase subunit SecE
MERIRQFFKEVKAELKKVVYPSREELIGSTWVVIISVVVVSFFLGIIDVGLQQVIRALLRW